MQKQGEKKLGEGPNEHGERKRKRQKRTEVWRESKRRERTKERKRGAIAGRMQMLLRGTDEVDFWWLMNFEQLVSNVKVFQRKTKTIHCPL